MSKRIRLLVFLSILFSLVVVPIISQAGESTKSEPAAKININTATVSDLMKLPGIGKVKAQAIVNYRKEHGPFKELSEIKKVKGIGDGIYKKVADKITLK